MSSGVVQVKRGAAVTILIAALIAGAFLGTWAIRWASHEVLGAPNVPVKMAGNLNPVLLGGFSNGFASVVRPALPAVVNISTTRVIRTQQNAPGFFGDPFFQQFFGRQFGPSVPQTEKEHSLGSGVIINPDGYILTNNHVVAHGSDIEVVWNNKEYKGKVVGTDPQTDIAVVKIDATGLPTLTFGDSAKLQVGDVVFAIGDPFGIGETATMGIVSAMGRSNLNIEGSQQRGGRQSYEDFIQTDAAINPGNSGGALIDLHGNLIGINTAILSSGAGPDGEGGNEGIGFAIPINLARNIMQQIIEHGKVERGHIGLVITNLTPDLAKAFGYTAGGTGALVNQVTAGGPAERAGIKRGDIILALNGEPITGFGDLTAQIVNSAPGTVMHLKVFRDGKTFDVPVTLASGAPEQADNLVGGGGESAQPAEPSENPGKALEGVKVEALAPDIAQQLNLPLSTKGVVVDSVEQSSDAAEGGLQRGDVILEVNHKPVTTVQEFRSALAGTDNQPVLLLVIPAGQPNTTVYLLIQSGS
ncbi:MAG TPA: Do family serine endopeptidase [Candidatus Acidoferrales bacterium]|nr:Do family serine endopeptidase [Candidatus Acidoferrales bacterium]